MPFAGVFSRLLDRGVDGCSVVEPKSSEERVGKSAVLTSGCGVDTLTAPAPPPKPQPAPPTNPISREGRLGYVPPRGLLTLSGMELARLARSVIFGRDSRPIKTRRIEDHRMDAGSRLGQSPSLYMSALVALILTTRAPFLIGQPLEFDLFPQRHRVARERLVLLFSWPILGPLRARDHARLEPRSSCSVA